MNIPLVVIVGRPNVGKSTLFNRLVGKRNAIVDSISGVTRDRNYGEVEWCGKIFNLVDTGGFVPDSENLFEKAITEQIDFAIEESDAIIFLVDVNDGVTPVDREISNRLRKSNKPVFLVINKTDNSEKELNTYVFHELGFENQYTISAQFGRQIGDFLDTLTKDFPLNVELVEEKAAVPKFAVIGRPNVGKSSFVNAVLGYQRSIVTEIPGTTRDSLDSNLKYYGQEILLVDTAGLRRKSKINESLEFYSVLRTLKAIDRCNVAIILLDATQGLEHQDMKILNEAVKRKRGIIICVNKWDLIEKDEKTARRFELALKEQLGEYDYIPVIFISCLTKQRIYKVIELSLKIFDNLNKKISTSEFNHFLEEVLSNFSLPSTPTGREVKIKYGLQLKSNPPVFAFFTNEPKHIQENTKKYLEKRIREAFGFEGVPLTLIFKLK